MRIRYFLTQWCYVAVGPFARTWWEPHVAGSSRNGHCESFCFLCAEQQVHGPCEHSYAALILQGVIPAELIMEECEGDDPRRSRGPVLPSIASLVPTAKVDSATPKPATATSPSTRRCGDTFGVEERLLALLRSFGLASPERLEAIRANEVTIETLARADLASLSTCLNLPFGKAERLQHEARERLGAGPSMPNGWLDTSSGSDTSESLGRIVEKADGSGEVLPHVLRRFVGVALKLPPGVLAAPARLLPHRPQLCLQAPARRAVRKSYNRMA